MDQPDNMSTEQWLKDSHIFSAHTYSIFQEDEVLTMASLKGMNSEQLSVFLSRPFKLGAQTALKQLLCNTGRAGSRPDSSSNVRRSPAPAEAPHLRTGTNGNSRLRDGAQAAASACSNGVDALHVLLAAADADGVLPGAPSACKHSPRSSVESVEVKEDAVRESKDTEDEEIRKSALQRLVRNVTSSMTQLLHQKFNKKHDGKVCCVAL